MSPLEVVKPEDEGFVPKIVVDRRLWLTADRERLVEDGDPEAAFLFATPGKRIPRDQAERYGLADEPKRRGKTQDKQAKRSVDKSSGGGEEKADGEG